MSPSEPPRVTALSMPGVFPRWPAKPVLADLGSHPPRRDYEGLLQSGGCVPGEGRSTDIRGDSGRRSSQTLLCTPPVGICRAPSPSRSGAAAREAVPRQAAGRFDREAAHVLDTLASPELGLVEMTKGWHDLDPRPDRDPHLTDGRSSPALSLGGGSSETSSVPPTSAGTKPEEVDPPQA